MISTPLLLSFVIGYFIVLLAVAWYTSRNSNNESFFIGNRSSNWMLVAFGMIGTSLSGVTFVSVPGAVGNGLPPGQFNYFQVVIGYFIGYLVIAYVLLPLYYRLNLTSIYKYLDTRFGTGAHKTGSAFFILSRTLGATARLYLVVNILQIFILDKMGIPFWITALVILVMILLYTFEGGVKTIVYTDTLQTSGMLIGLIVSVVVIMNTLHLNLGSTFSELRSAGLTEIFNMDVNSPNFFLKQILGGAVITIAMTGLDQEMMQKNISVNKLHNSQKNIMTFSTVLVVVNMLFLILGGLLYLYAAKNNIGIKGDDLFPQIALHSGFSDAMSLIFIIALISALFPSVDGAITALTSSFCIDIIGLNTEQPDPAKSARKAQWLLLIGALFTLLIFWVSRNTLFEFRWNNSIALGGWMLVLCLAAVYWFSLSRPKKDAEYHKKVTRLFVHFSFAVIFYALVILFKWVNEKSIIDFILKVAGFTYGPLLGLFFFGILTKRMPVGKWIAGVCLAALLLTVVLDFCNNPQWYQNKFSLTGDFIEGMKQKSVNLFGGKLVDKPVLTDGVETGRKIVLEGGYKIGYELMLINGLFTFAGLWLISRKPKNP